MADPATEISVSMLLVTAGGVVAALLVPGLSGLLWLVARISSTKTSVDNLKTEIAELKKEMTLERHEIDNRFEKVESRQDELGKQIHEEVNTMRNRLHEAVNTMNQHMMETRVLLSRLLPPGLQIEQKSKP